MSALGSQTSDGRIQPPRSTSNVLANWLAFAFAVVVNLFLSPFIVHSLGDTAYGIWVLLAQVVGYMGLLDLGVRSAVMRYSARYHALGDDAEARRVASAALAMFLAFGAAAVVAAVGLAPFIGRLFNLPAPLARVARVVLVLGGVNVAVSLVSGVYGGVVSGLQRFDLLAWSEMVIAAARAAAIVVALGSGGDLVALAVIQLAATALRGAWQYLLSRRLYPEVRFLDRSWQRRHVRDIFAFGAYSSILHVSGVLMLSADAVVIGAFLPVGMITFFAIGATLTDYARSVIQAISQNVAPRASALEARGATDELRTVALRFGRIATLVMFPMTLTFLLRGGTFIGLWMGPAYAGPSGAVLLILSLALTLAAARQVAMASLSGLNRHRRLAPFYVAEALLNLGMSIYWIRDLGIVGVAWGTTVPNLVTSLLVIPWLVREALGVPIRSIWLEFWARPALAMLPFALLTGLVEWAWPAGNLVLFFAQVALVLPAAALGAWFVGLRRSERVGYLAAARTPARAALARLGLRPAPLWTRRDRP